MGVLLNYDAGSPKGNFDDLNNLLYVNCFNIGGNTRYTLIVDFMVFLDCIIGSQQLHRSKRPPWFPKKPHLLACEYVSY